MQATAMGKRFRQLYPTGKNDPTGAGFLRLHNTYCHDLKIYASDEGRVQMTTAAFAKGMLAMDAEPAAMIVHMINSADTDGLLGRLGSSKKKSRSSKVKISVGSSGSVPERLISTDVINKSVKEEFIYPQLPTTAVIGTASTSPGLWSAMTTPQNAQDVTCCVPPLHALTTLSNRLTFAKLNEFLKRMSQEMPLGTKPQPLVPFQSTLNVTTQGRTEIEGSSKPFVVRKTIETADGQFDITIGMKAGFKPKPKEAANSLS